MTGVPTRGPPSGASRHWIRLSRVSYAGATSSADRLRPKTAKARITRPIPVSTRAIPTTIPKIEICSAMYETLSAVESAVSLIQMLRAPFEIGWPLATEVNFYGRYHCVEHRMDGKDRVYAAASEMRADGCALAY